MPLLPPKPAEFGVYKDQTLLKTTKVLHEDEKVKLVQPWLLYAGIIGFLILCIIAGTMLFFPALRPVFGAKKAAVTAYHQTFSYPIVPDSPFVYDLQDEYAESIGTEAFRAAYSPSDISKVKGVTIVGTTPTGKPIYVDYIVAKVHGKWIVAEYRIPE